MSKAMQRAIVCCYCGTAFDYDGEEKRDAVAARAVEHEKTCERNPYRAEIERLTVALADAREEGRQEASELYLKRYSDGVMTFEVDANLLICMAGYLASVLDAHKAPNFVEIRLREPGETHGNLILRVQREPGKTPSDLLAELRTKHERLRSILCVVLPECAVCPACGPVVKTDEDGCCVHCGADCELSPTNEWLESL